MILLRQMAGSPDRKTKWMDNLQHGAEYTMLAGLVVGPIVLMVGAGIAEAHQEATDVARTGGYDLKSIGNRSYLVELHQSVTHPRQISTQRVPIDVILGNASDRIRRETGCDITTQEPVGKPPIAYIVFTNCR